MKTVLLLISFVLATYQLSDAQQPKKIPRIGILEPATPVSVSARVAALRQGLRDLGYIEGQTLQVEYRYANGNPERLADLAAELVSMKLDLIATSQTPSVLLARADKVIK